LDRGTRNIHHPSGGAMEWATWTDRQQHGQHGDFLLFVPNMMRAGPTAMQDGRRRLGRETRRRGFSISQRAIIGGASSIWIFHTFISCWTNSSPNNGNWQQRERERERERLSSPPLFFTTHPSIHPSSLQLVSPGRAVREGKDSICQRISLI
jgi:hypothetical protein